MYKKLYVIGTFIMDLVVKSDKMPDTGETVIGTDYNIYPGGKGVNQAIAVARLGGDVSLLGRVGNDDYGKAFLKLLKEENVNYDHVYVSEKSNNGIGFISVDSKGENRIVIVLGANKEITRGDVELYFKDIKKGSIVMTQLEIDIDIVEFFIEKAKEKEVIIIMDPAPGRVLKDSMLNGIDYLTPNEVELNMLLNKTFNSMEDIEEGAKELYNKGIKNVIVTLGDKGACIYNEKGFKHFPSNHVKALDTTGAGDAFNGGLAYMLSKGHQEYESIQFANKIASLAVTKNGAIPSLPYITEL